MILRLLVYISVFTCLACAETWQDREHAFYSSRNAKPSPARLISALTKDVAWSKTQPSLKEEFTSYQGDLIAAVIRFKDPRSMNVLFQLIDTGDMALSTLAGFGDESAMRAIAVLRDKHGRETVRHSAMLLLYKMTEPQNLARIKRPQVRAKLYSSLADCGIRP